MGSKSFAALVTVLLLGICPVARASDDQVDIHESAKKLSRAATEAYAAGRYEEAAARFQEAYLLFPAPQIVLNLSRTELKLGHCDRAIAYALTYGTVVGQGATDQRDSPEEWLARVKAQCPEVEISSDPPGVSVALNGTIPIAPLVTPFKGRLPAGEYTVRASLAGYEDQKATLHVDAATPSHLQLSLARTPVPIVAEAKPVAPASASSVVLAPAPSEARPAWAAGATEAVPATRPTTSLGRTIGIAVAAVGGAALITAIALGVTANSETTVAETKVPTQSLQSQLNSIKGRAIGADALFGVGGVLAAVGVGLTVAL